MNLSKGKPLWKIQIYDGVSLLYERKVAYGQITENSMRDLLKALVAKHALNPDEIVGSFSKKGTKIHNELLSVSHLNGEYCGFTCGSNPYAIAVLEHAL